VTTNAVKVNKEKVTIDAANFPEGAPYGSKRFLPVPSRTKPATTSPALPLSLELHVKPDSRAGGQDASQGNGPSAGQQRQQRSVNARLVLDFDEKVKKGQGAIVLTQGSNT
jgi:hypothetical protein